MTDVVYAILDKAAENSAVADDSPKRKRTRIAKKDTSKVYTVNGDEGENLDSKSNRKKKKVESPSLFSDLPAAAPQPEEEEAPAAPAPKRRGRKSKAELAAEAAAAEAAEQAAMEAAQRGCRRGPISCPEADFIPRLDFVPRQATSPTIMPMRMPLTLSSSSASSSPTARSSRHTLSIPTRLMRTVYGLATRATAPTSSPWSTCPSRTRLPSLHSTSSTALWPAARSQEDRLSREDNQYASQIRLRRFHHR